MKAVVTGGAGFIGSCLVCKLVEQGRDVVVADDLSRGKEANLGEIGGKVELQRVDLRDAAAALKATEGAETVFHLAARIGSLDFLHGSDSAELEALQANLTIDTNVFRACVANGVKRVVYASSVAVYSMDPQAGENVVLSEAELELVGHYPQGSQPDGGYGWAKLLGEIQLNWTNSLDVGIARIFNIYGENQDLEMAVHVVPSLIRKALNYPENDFIVWGDGRQSRDFLHVSDCADALLKLEELAGKPPITVNVGSGVTTSIGLLAETVVKLSEKGMPVVYDTDKPVGPVSRTANITKARKSLGWEPSVSLEDGLGRAMRWMKGLL